MDQFNTSPAPLSYRSKDILRVATQLWNDFYSKVSAVDNTCDFAVWIIPRGQGWFAIRSGSTDDSESDNTCFALSVTVTGYEDLWRVADGSGQKKDVLHKQFESWILDAVHDAWHTAPIQSLHRQIVGGMLGIYSTPVHDWAYGEFDWLTWIGGDKLDFSVASSQTRRSARKKT